MTRDDPEWRRAGAWLAGDHLPNPAGTLAVLGAPLRLGSLTPGRSDLGPGAIREALAFFSTFDVEERLDLRHLRAIDAGDLPIVECTPEQAFAPVMQRARELLGEADALVILGGDNSVTRPGLHGLGLPLDRCGLLTIDAHFDLRSLADGLTNGNPVRALLADGLPGANLIQIGIQSFANSDAAVEVARAAGSRFVTVGQVRRTGIETVMEAALAYLDRRVEAIYVDLDLDALDRAFSPATPGSRPGGLNCWEALQAARLCGLAPKVRALDLVELDPTRDVANVTALSAARFLLAFASGLLARGTREV